ncbi:hypothetical protein SAMN05216516_10541 [Izhakiella capsodis]|uniref:Uncharacterized protein n=2 Tax=Izhakiella capsodis TaxID=1367852 RepID=A0A1I4XWB4_9GAMM|nr:hypothetical protein SAMN05216516_10541 [Izhakiella capsodis]
MPGQGDIALISCGESERFARLSGRTFIIDDGEILQGEVLDDVIVVGVVTHIIIALEVSDVPF